MTTIALAQQYFNLSSPSYLQDYLHSKKKLFSLPEKTGRRRPIGNIWHIAFHRDLQFCQCRGGEHQWQCVSRMRWGWYRWSGSSSKCWAHSLGCRACEHNQWDRQRIVVMSQEWRRLSSKWLKICSLAGKLWHQFSLSWIWARSSGLRMSPTFWVKK